MSHTFSRDENMDGVSECETEIESEYGPKSNNGVGEGKRKEDDEISSESNEDSADESESNGDGASGEGTSDVPVGGVSTDDIMNMQSESREDAYDFYRGFGKISGFGIRKGDSGKDSKGNLVRYRFFCNRKVSETVSIQQG
ncbi:hypothetical protein PIB30_097539 [Stylosanthes scabra]|uniref:FAR1 domain-containing protein n=1 Tax=Stylosanthes scabra TaxID=79078 RepID=A0ABU6VWE8_9FABA|nr:hypothetical protein [Stylosanthes scabra]